MKDDKGKINIRARFAPSPTGELHIGGLKTALFDYLLAKQNNGKFVLRIEDTDRKRLVKGAIRRIIKSLKWAGIEIDEGVKLNGKDELIEKGDYGPYIQSKRLDIYDKYVQKLLDEKKAYYCFCPATRLAEMREKQQEKKQAPKYDRHCLNLSAEEIERKIKAGEKYVVRFKVPKGKTIFTDLVFGRVEVENENIDDQIIMKSDGFPTYHLAVVVDDYLMKISHIIRGAEWIASTPKHILLYKALDWQDAIPKFVHMSNILNKNKKKLSKREGSVSVEDFKKQGYPSEAIINFIALLGWNPKTEQEVFTMNDLIKQFSIRKMNKSGGVFDVDRLNWISKEHIKKMNLDKLYDAVMPFLKKKIFYKHWLENVSWDNLKREKYIKKILAVEQARLEKFTEVGDNNRFFFTDKIVITKDSLRWKNSTDEDTKNNLESAKATLAKISQNKWDKENLEDKLLKIAGDKRGDLLFPLRSALTGQAKSPSPFEVAWVLGKEKSIRRLKNAIAECEKK